METSLPRTEIGRPSFAKARNAVGYLAIVAHGVDLGRADAVPDVSGGARAFILGIYEERIESIH